MELEAAVQTSRERGFGDRSAYCRYVRDLHLRRAGNRHGEITSKLSRRSAYHSRYRCDDSAAGRGNHLSRPPLFRFTKSRRAFARNHRRNLNVCRTAHAAILARHRRDFGHSCAESCHNRCSRTNWTAASLLRDPPRLQRHSITNYNSRSLCSSALSFVATRRRRWCSDLGRALSRLSK